MLLPHFEQLLFKFAQIDWTIIQIKVVNF